MKGAVSAQKAFQGFEMETRELLGETEENSVSLMKDFSQKGKRNKIEWPDLVASKLFLGFGCCFDRGFIGAFHFSDF